MPLNDYLNLFVDAGITGHFDQEKYSRYIDTAIAQEGINADEIIGVGERQFSQLYVVSHQAVISVHESGMFKKRVEVEREAPVASIAKLAATNVEPSAAAIKFEGRSARCTLTGWDSKGKIVLEIVWNDSESREITRQRKHLSKLIEGAMGKVQDAPAHPSVSTAASKAAYLMDWSADVVKASGVEITRERIEEHANIIAAGIRFRVFLKLGAPYGIDDLGKFYPNGAMPPGTIIATFDDLYRHVVVLVGDARPVDQEIDLLLARSWGEFVNGCRETYS
jgi:hypothetical protein